MKDKKVAKSVYVLKSLWETINNYAIENDTSISKMFKIYAYEVLNNEYPLVIDYKRENRIYAKEIKHEFKRIRAGLYLPKSLIDNLYKHYGEEVPFTAIAHSVFYYICRDKNLKIDENFFDNDYFAKIDKDKIILMLRNLSNKLGKIPSRKEYSFHKDLVNAPSNTYINKIFGSYENALKAAGLEYKKPVKESNIKKTKVFWNIDNKNHISIKITKCNKNKEIIRETKYYFNKDEIRQLLVVLDYKYREVLRFRFGLDSIVKLQREVAVELGINKPYVADIEKRAIIKMMKFYENNKK